MHTLRSISTTGLEKTFNTTYPQWYFSIESSYLKENMAHPIICRCGFCQECFKEGRPHSQDPFLAYGSNNKDYVYRRALGNGIRGFVPTIYKALNILGQNVIINYACSFCDCVMWDDGQGWRYEIKWKRGLLHLEDWNALVTFKDDSYRI